MSDVRDELIKFAGETWYKGKNSETIADAILERFDVTPKPVVSPRVLGGMVYRAWADVEANTLETQWAEAGMHMVAELAEAGFKIVRVSDD